MVARMPCDALLVIAGAALSCCPNNPRAYRTRPSVRRSRSFYNMFELHPRKYKLIFTATLSFQRTANLDRSRFGTKTVAACLFAPAGHKGGHRTRWRGTHITLGAPFFFCRPPHSPLSHTRKQDRKELVGPTQPSSAASLPFDSGKDLRPEQPRDEDGELREHSRGESRIEFEKYGYPYLFFFASGDHTARSLCGHALFSLVVPWGAACPTSVPAQHKRE